MMHDFYGLQYDQIIISIHCLTGMTQVEINEEMKEFILRLKKRAEDLVRLTVQGEGEGSEMMINEENYKLEENAEHRVDISDVDYYLKNEKLREMKE